MAKTTEKKRLYSNPGKRIAIVHAIRIDEYGHKTLVDTGERTNTYEIIQSHFDEVNMENILAKYDAEGPEALLRKESMYADVTSAPKDMIEAQMKLQDITNQFNSLPIDIRRNFNFSVNEYIAAARNPEELATKLGYIKTEEKIKEPEPTQEEGEA